MRKNPGYGVQATSRLKPQCTNTNFDDQRKVLHKGGEPEINYIKRFQNSKALEISIGNSYY